MWAFNIVFIVQYSFWRGTMKARNLINVNFAVFELRVRYKRVPYCVMVHTSLKKTLVRTLA